MVTRRTVIGGVAAALLPRAAAAEDLETPFFAAQVAEGKLPPLAQRLPEVPRIVRLTDMGRVPGRPGGEIRTLIGSQKDIRLMTIYGYTRLIGFDQQLRLQADVLESFEVQEDRIFTFRIRPGHKWSDGSPLTSEDFRYCWEDVISNRELSPGGFAQQLLSDGKPPVFEVIDSNTVRYTWEVPNPEFLPELAAAQALSLVMPAAYLKQFHKNYQTEERLEELIKANKAKKWTALHTRMARQYRPENPDLPTLDPWRNTTAPPAEQFIFERNPFFHRIDETGRQLPYIDRFILSISSSSIIPAKTGAGESDLQCVGLDFSDYTFLKQSEKLHPINVNLWKRTQGSRLALLPNLNCADEVWRKLFWDVRVRRALSVAIDRNEINGAVFFGLAKVSGNTMLPESSLYSPEAARAWTEYDPEKANALLDAAGLTNRDSSGMRLLSDGRIAKITVETAGESTLETDVLELVTDYWAKVGIGLFVRTSQRDVFRSRAIGGQILMSIWSGLDNGVATPDMSPSELAPTSDDQLQWPVWGMYAQSHGESGTAPELPEAEELFRLYKQWRLTRSTEERTVIWTRMLEIYSEQVFSIGLVNAALQPVIRTNKMRNMPDTGLYGFSTSYLGIYMPDTFWLEQDS